MYKRQEIELSTVLKNERVRICTEWLKKQINFEKIVFTDEVRFNLDGPDSMMTWSYGKNRPRKVTRCMGGGSVLLSGGLFMTVSYFCIFWIKISTLMPISIILKKTCCLLLIAR